MNATRRAKISALGRYVPPRAVTNYDLAKRVDTNHDWVVTRTGIVERHWVEPGTPTSELAAKAVDNLLQARGIEADEIDLIIVATVTPDMFFPATACIVQNKVRATHAWASISPPHVRAFFMRLRWVRSLYLADDMKRSL
jgi:3-oxoacyl-[acyl-carrier-protein] synthase-3